MNTPKRRYGNLTPGSWKKVIFYVILLIIILVAIFLLRNESFVRKFIP